MALFGKNKKDELDELEGLMDKDKKGDEEDESETDDEEETTEEGENDEEEEMSYVKKKPTKNEKNGKKKPLPKPKVMPKAPPQEEPQDWDSTEQPAEEPEEAPVREKPVQPKATPPAQINKETLTKTIMDFARTVPQVDVESWYIQMMSDGSAIMIPVNVVGNPTLRGFLSAKPNSLRQLKKWLATLPD